jgi:hypothetical protein
MTEVKCSLYKVINFVQRKRTCDGLVQPESWPPQQTKSYKPTWQIFQMQMLKTDLAHMFIAALFAITEI